jgi:rhodanese-related sulfurtransferase
MVQSITAHDLHERVSRGESVNLIDVRMPFEFQNKHLQGSRNRPLDRLDPSSLLGERSISSDHPVYVVCRSGARSKKACEYLLSSGLSHIVNVEGGIIACEAAGMQVIQGNVSIPLHGQVQMIVGTLVTIGAVLASYGQVYGAMIAGLMGAGLLHSGTTDTCVLGSFLSKMPWNNRSTKQSYTNENDDVVCQR